MADDREPAGLTPGSPTHLELDEPALAKMERPLWHRAVALLAGLALLAGGVAFGLNRYFDWNTLQTHRDELRMLVESYWYLVIPVYLLLYSVIVVSSVPGCVVMTIVGGFLFGQIFGSLLAVTGATMGATIVFVVARGALGPWIRRRAGPWIVKIERGFAENGMSFLLVLRLIPLFPFFILNLVLPFVGLPLRRYVLGTFLGILPANFFYASFGAGLGVIFDRGDKVSWHSVLTPEMIMGLSGLAVLALLPVLYKYWQHRRRQTRGQA
jgi:uncharacterized membrane protein YdjX (TVP38/TMEM64 family)